MFKRSIPLCLILAIVCLSTSLFAQTPLPTLIEEFSPGLDCQQPAAQSRILQIELENNPADTATIVIVGGKDNVIGNLLMELLVGEVVESGRKMIDPKRIKVIKTGLVSKPRVEFWRVPPGSERSYDDTGRDYGNGGQWSAELSGLTEPFMLEPDYFYDDILGICGKNVEKLFGILLKANPGMRGNIVLYEISKGNYLSERKNLLIRLKGAGISAKRIRTFFIKSQPDISGFVDIADQDLPTSRPPEFWLLP